MWVHYPVKETCCSMDWCENGCERLLACNSIVLNKKEQNGVWCQVNSISYHYTEMPVGATEKSWKWKKSWKGRQIQVKRVQNGLKINKIVKISSKLGSVIKAGVFTYSLVCQHKSEMLTLSMVCITTLGNFCLWSKAFKIDCPYWPTEKC